jgi:hypothetical protein
MTPRSGSNELKETFFITRPGPSIDSKSTFAQRDYPNQVKDGYKISSWCRRWWYYS